MGSLNLHTLNKDKQVEQLAWASKQSKDKQQDQKAIKHKTSEHLL